MSTAATPQKIDCTFSQDAWARFEHMPPKEQTQFIIELLDHLMANSQSLPQEERDNYAKMLIDKLNTNLSTDAKISINMWRTALFTAITNSVLTTPSQEALIASLQKLPKKQALNVQATLATAAGLELTTTSSKAHTLTTIATFISGAIMMASLANLRYAPNKKTAFALCIPTLGRLIAGSTITHLTQSLITGPTEQAALALTTQAQTSWEKTKYWYEGTANTRASMRKHLWNNKYRYIAGLAAVGATYMLGTKIKHFFHCLSTYKASAAATPSAPSVPTPTQQPPAPSFATAPAVLPETGNAVLENVLPEAVLAETTKAVEQNVSEAVLAETTSAVLENVLPEAVLAETTKAVAQNVSEALATVLPTE